MTGSPESAFNNSAARSPRILVCGVNWIGDSVMSMPALQAFRRLHPDAEITLLVKPAVRALWELHSTPDRLLVLEPGLKGVWRTARRLRSLRFQAAYILPHSFRSALVPFLAGIPERVGMPGHGRDWMLTRRLPPRQVAGSPHQSYEYLELLAPEQAGQPVEPPALRIPDAVCRKMANRLAGFPRPRIGLIPGAARGPSKQWPAGHYVELGRRLAAARPCGLLVFGAPAEAPVCEEVASRIGPAALSLAGKVTVAEWAALLAQCDVVVANDSGGMHVAAAAGAGVVALFGHTDPARTGPLGARCRIVQESDVRDRDIARDSRKARQALAAIRPERVQREVQALLESGQPEPVPNEVAAPARRTLWQKLRGEGKSPPARTP
jgi:heptosyltransferase-2